MIEKNLSFLGAGAIAEALIRGLLDAGAARADRIRVANRWNGQKKDSLARRYGVVAVERPEAIRRGEVLILAMKPKDAGDALVEVRDHLQGQPLILSVLAGIPTEWIERQLGGQIPVIRAMPNTSCRVRESATALAPGRYATAEQMNLAEQIFAAVGRVVVVPESQMDAVTGLSGSGPAYVYYLAEALMASGREMGLDEKVCRGLVEQTLYGAALMLRNTEESPETLRRQVTSPGGTTEAGIQVLELRHVAEALREAVRRAAERSRELQEAFAESAASEADG
ncbi:pyrroline-5-carboxylate reductase [Kyrpidia spormannii]|uniref:Pyrroline-5-carboxylate reductase n=1 Tax=Kyrpidia spormannii TaxID=2055160 RepID=A0A2K8N4I1_9BACL|nr:pyrroline-5-carboxylate reductase [Kyrpidia spormannii]ATY84304.1 pyrroline-5-carboxylate reductase [Kyrpidia spormannii]